MGRRVVVQGRWGRMAADEIDLSEELEEDGLGNNRPDAPASGAAEAGAGDNPS